MEEWQIDKFLIHSLNLNKAHVFSHPKESRFKSFFENLKYKKKKKTMSVNPKDIILGNDKRTSIIIKNIPNDLTPEQFWQIINKFCQNIDFYYVPLKIMTRKKLRVAFLNVINYIDIVTIFMGLKYKSKFVYESPGVEIEICYSKVQGKGHLFKRFFHEFSLCK